MIERLPAGAIIAAVEREGQMLADDLAHGRTQFDSEAHSILSFCHFLKAVRLGAEFSPVVLPMSDTAFYRKTTERLVKIGQLPAAAQQQFDRVFSQPALKLLISL